MNYGSSLQESFNPHVHHHHICLRQEATLF